MLAETQIDELDAGPRQRGPGQERTCAVTRTVRPADELIRFVAGPGGVVPDLKRKLPGRGLWVGADRTTIAQAVARKVFARGFKRDVDVPADLPARTEELLVRSVLDALAIVGKSGQALTGFSKVEAALAHDNVTALLHASDAGADGVAKLAAALRNRPDAERIAVVRTLTSGQLDLALGRSNVVHAALTAGTASDTFLTRLRRLERFRTGFSGASAGARARN
ncbi:MAG: RNA-binding protein [Alphaproteobacteria bacterium]|nr:RNA-binding protein [Alphaproteobacteria bacterium]